MAKIFFPIVVVLAQTLMAISVLTEADADATRVARVGETVELRLPENPSTGYRWFLEIDPPEAATIVASHWTPAGAGVGAAGSRTFEISINEPGTATFRAKLWREWQGEGSVIERRVFTIQVH